MSESGRAGRRWNGHLVTRWALNGLAAVLVWLAWIDAPEPPMGELDDSWQAVLGYAHRQNLDFGREVLFTHGPWGWLASHYLMPGEIAGKRTWELAGKLGLSLFFVWAVQPLPPGRRVALILLLPVCGMFFPDTHLAAIIVLAVLLRMMDDRASATASAAAAALIGFLGTMKFTYAVLGAAGIGLTMIKFLIQKDWRRLGPLLLAGGGAFLAAWMLSGNSLLLLVDHFRMSLELSGGYGAAMSVDEPWPVFLSGAFATLWMVGCVFLLLKERARTAQAWPAAAYLVFATYVMWKHGFSRADGHVFALFGHVTLLGVAAAPALGWPKRWDPFLVASAAGVAGMFLWDASLVRQAPRLVKGHLQHGIHYVTNGGAAEATYETALAARRAAVEDSELRHEAGSESIDAINYHQAALLLNDLNYVGRPVIQSYSAYTPTLLRRNLRFLQRERAPQFLLWRQGTIDGRFPSLDDSLLIAEIPRRYEPVRPTSLGLLLRRRTSQPDSPDASYEELDARHLEWGERLELPDQPATALWLEVLFQSSAVGKLRSVLYKPGSIQMVVTDDSRRETRHRILPAIAEVGFLVHPFLETQEDLVLFAEGKTRQALRALSFEPAREDERELWARIHVRLFRLPELPARLISRYAQYVELGLMNEAPELVSSGVGVHLIEEDARPGLLVHPPGEIVFDAGSGPTCVSGSFGIRSDAYQGAGATDGVSFSLLAEDATGGRTVVWTRTLRPLEQPADRGLQHFRGCASAGMVRLVLATGAGDNGNTDWDWAYWADLHLER